MTAHAQAARESLDALRGRRQTVIGLLEQPRMDDDAEALLLVEGVASLFDAVEAIGHGLSAVADAVDGLTAAVEAKIV